MESALANLSSEDLVQSYGSLVSTLCRRMIQNEADAEDAAQEAWLAIWKGLPGFRGDAALSTWIYTVTYHTVMRHSKSEKRYSTRFLRNYFHGEPLEVPYQVDYDQRVWIREMCDKCLTGVVHCLDAESRMAYLFRDVTQLDYDDIAVIMGKDPAAIRQTVSRCRRKLKNFLNDECALANPGGSCQCRMKHLVAGMELPQEYLKLRRFANRVNLYLESREILPSKNYWEKYLA